MLIKRQFGNTAVYNITGGALSHCGAKSQPKRCAGPHPDQQSQARNYSVLQRTWCNGNVYVMFTWCDLMVMLVWCDVQYTLLARYTCVGLLTLHLWTNAGIALDAVVVQHLPCFTDLSSQQKKVRAGMLRWTLWAGFRKDYQKLMWNSWRWACCLKSGVLIYL